MGVAKVTTGTIILLLVPEPQQTNLVLLEPLNFAVNVSNTRQCKTPKQNKKSVRSLQPIRHVVKEERVIPGRKPLGKGCK